MFSRLMKLRHELTRDMLSNLNQAGSVKNDWSPQTICKVILYIRKFTLHTFWPSLLRKLSRPITQPIFIQHSTLSLNNASKVNQSSCNSILCKPYLFARAGDWGGQVVLSSALWGEGGWGAQPDNISPSLLFKSPMCRKASYLLNGLSGFIKGKSI